MVSGESGRSLKGLGLESYLPLRIQTRGMGVRKIYESHLRALKECSLLVAVLDGSDVDSGTASNSAISGL